ncbi:hypothetical protein INT46_009927 [Mucor plumbeus]|uniref:Uncharacterized protein n=1 Tax=Mucor plumbeus TaxID=97098 RepID=A0A8H7RAE3_9FUNG|nr:hypothetical protein INT46_009927 [Mucor plumbeus]
MSATVLYDKAFRSYLLTKYTPAANTCLKAIAALKDDDQKSTRLNIWTLYLNITSTLLVDTPFLGINMKLLGIQSVSSIEEVCRSIWKKVTEEGYQGVGNTDSRLVSACIAMSIQLNQLSVARNIAEEWFASLSDEVMDHISANRDQDQITEGYNKVVELYVGRTLPRMHDFESANTFLDYNSVLTDSKKKALKSIIKQEQESVENEHKKKIQAEKELEEKKKEDERLLIEEAKRIEQEKIAQEKEKEEQERKTQAEKLRQETEIDTTSRSVVVSQPSSSSSPPPSQQPSQQQTVIQKWMNKITTKGTTTSGAILILIFALFALLRGQRGRLSIAFQGLMNKLWQTIKMGTKVTYM